MRRGQFDGAYWLIAIGIVMLLWNFGYIPRDWEQWWPALLIVLGVLAIIARTQRPAPAVAPAPAPSAEPVRRRGRFGGGIFLIGIGVAFLLSNAIGRDSFPALILIAIGLASLANRYW